MIRRPAGSMEVTNAACAGWRRRSVVERSWASCGQARSGYSSPSTLQQRMAMDLHIVTGASRGLGLALTRLLVAQANSRVLSISRAGVPSGTGVWRDLRADLSAGDEQNAAVLAIESALASGPWDKAVLINNAASLDPLGVLGRADAA